MSIDPSNVCLGDRVCVLLGGGLPYVARGCGKYWSLIGESYIDRLIEREIS
jgi:hypothetical protein